MLKHPHLEDMMKDNSIIHEYIPNENDISLNNIFEIKIVGDHFNKVIVNDDFNKM